MVVRAENMVQRPLTMPWSMRLTHSLIDEARTPLIVSGANAAETSQPLPYGGPLREILWTRTTISLTFSLRRSVCQILGIDKAESYFKLENLYDIENVALTTLSTMPSVPTIS